MARGFNGSSDRIGVDGAFYGPNWFTDAYSLSVWVKASAQANTGVYSEGRSSTNTSFWWIGPDSTSTSKMRWTGGAPGPAAQITTATVFDNTWHHYALTIGANYTIFVDGAIDIGPTNITSGQTGMAHTGDRATVGSLGRITYGNFFNGAIAELAIWTARTLSSNEVKSLANGLSPSRMGPTHYWPLWGVDSPEPDIGLG